MTVTQVTPGELSPSALLALKQARRITTTNDDAVLLCELRAAINACENYTRRILINRAFDEILPVRRDWQALRCGPVTAIESVTGLPLEGAEFALAVNAYAIDIHADGEGRVMVKRPGSAGRVKVRYSAGLATDWGEIPETLRQGILIAASQGFLNRNGPDIAPLPANIAALWHPWRLVRLG